MAYPLPARRRHRARRSWPRLFGSEHCLGVWRAPGEAGPVDKALIRDATNDDFPRIVALNAAEVARQWLDDGRKQVSLQAAPATG